MDLDAKTEYRELNSASHLVLAILESMGTSFSSLSTHMDGCVMPTTQTTETTV